MRGRLKRDVGRIKEDRVPCGGEQKGEDGKDVNHSLSSGSRMANSLLINSDFACPKEIAFKHESLLIV
jgi:hypothetical protein